MATRCSVIAGAAVAALLACVDVGRGPRSDAGCSPPETECGAACVDTTSDPRNCGRCGHVCRGECRASVCVPVVLAR